MITILVFIALILTVISAIPKMKFPLWPAVLTLCLLHLFMIYGSGG